MHFNIPRNDSTHKKTKSFGWTLKPKHMQGENNGFGGQHLDKFAARDLNKQTV